MKLDKMEYLVYRNLDVTSFPSVSFQNSPCINIFSSIKERIISEFQSETGAVFGSSAEHEMVNGRMSAIFCCELLLFDFIHQAPKRCATELIAV